MLFRKGAWRGGEQYWEVEWNTVMRKGKAKNGLRQLPEFTRGDIYLPRKCLVDSPALEGGVQGDGRVQGEAEAWLSWLAKSAGITCGPPLPGLVHIPLQLLMSVKSVLEMALLTSGTGPLPSG